MNLSQEAFIAKISSSALRCHQAAENASTLNLNVLARFLDDAVTLIENGVACQQRAFRDSSLANQENHSVIIEKR